MNESQVDCFNAYLVNLQEEIKNALENLEGDDGNKFQVNEWNASTGTKVSLGKACVIESGNVFQKGGVNYSLIKNMCASQSLLSTMLQALPCDFNRDLEYNFDVCGISLILHPLNPFCPTIHMNYRLFELKNASNGMIVKRWYGGGCDLTPYYLFEEDATHFHGVLKGVCNKFDPSLYRIFKKNCDNYFYAEHRKEHRGIGGIFFDYQQPSEYKFDFGQFARMCGKNFLNSYLPIIKRRKCMEYNEKQVFWQQVRRSRYAEFNLVYDRGTKFGLFSPGVDIENVLVSLPPICRWVYKHTCEEGSHEERTVKVLSKARDWV